MDREQEERSAAVKFTTVNGNRDLAGAAHTISSHKEHSVDVEPSKQHSLSNQAKPGERQHDPSLSKRADEEDNGRNDADPQSSEDRYPYRPSKRKRSLDSFFRKSPDFQSSDQRRLGAFHPHADVGSPPRGLPPLNEFKPTKSTGASDQHSVWRQKRPAAAQMEDQLAESARRDSHQVYHGNREQTDAGDDVRMDLDSDSDPEDDTQREARSVQKNPNRPRQRNFSQRTKTGCHTCRRRKKKCDEGKPICENCSRGNFICEGYGPKSELNMKLPSKTIPLQAKGFGGHGPSVYRQSVSSASNEQWLETQRYPHESRVQPTSDGYGYNAAPAPRSLLHSDYASPLPSERFGRAPFPESARAPPPPSRFGMIAPPSVMPENNGRGMYHSSVGGRNSSISSGFGTPRNSIGTLSALNPPAATYAPFRPAPTTSDTEKSSMLSGQPFRHFADGQLRNDRALCQEAVERFNEASKPSRGISLDERQRLFVEIVRPERLLRDPDLRNHPIGSVGSQFIVEAPFYCDYGYNIHLGDDVVIQPGCVMYDPCTISIGRRTVIGPNVKFYGMGPSPDRNVNGSNGKVRGGTIMIEEDCWIGGDVIILANVTIGRASVIEAGTKVTKNVEPEVFYDGEAMRVLRERGLTTDEGYQTQAQAQARFDPYMNR